MDRFTFYACELRHPLSDVLATLIVLFALQERIEDSLRAWWIRQSPLCTAAGRKP